MGMWANKNITKGKQEKEQIQILQGILSVSTHTYGGEIWLKKEES
jgi:hypothetical protein